MFDQYIYKRNESNLDVSLSVPHYNGQHGQHYNMNDHPPKTSNLDDTFFDASSPVSSPARSFFHSDDSSSSRSISPILFEPSQSSSERFFSSSSSDGSSDSPMDVSDEDFFETSSGEELLFSERSEDSDSESENEAMRDSGFVLDSYVSSASLGAASTTKLNDAFANLNLSLDGDDTYWSSLMTCNRIQIDSLESKYCSINGKRKRCGESPVASKNFCRRNTVFSESRNQDARIGIPDREGIHNSEKSYHEFEKVTQMDSCHEIDNFEKKEFDDKKTSEIDKSIVHDEEAFEHISRNSFHEKELLSVYKDSVIPNPPELPAMANDVFLQDSLRVFPNVEKPTNDLGSQNHEIDSTRNLEAATDQLKDFLRENATLSEFHFGAGFFSSSETLTCSSDVTSSQTTQTQDSRSSTARTRKCSVIPSLELDPFCSLDDIPTRRKEIMSTIALIFNRLSELELEGRKLKLFVEAKATWDMCCMENSHLTRQSVPEAILKTIDFHHKKKKNRFVLIVFLLSEIFKMLANGSYCTKRELYYRDPLKAVHPRNINLALRDVSLLLKADLCELNIFASSRGLIAGPIKFYSNNEEVIDCCNSLGTQIPADVKGLTQIEVDADLVLIVEKDTVFQRLLNDGILTKLSKKIIVVTSKGYPDVGTRLLLKKIWDTTRTPMFALVDADPYGIEIYCVYKFGSLSLLHQSSQLAVPSIQWLGLRPSHLVLLNLKLLPLTERDRSRIQRMLKRPYIGHPGCELERELRLLHELDGKAEIESLTDISVDYLVTKYLPMQLRLFDLSNG
ncbi:uncharacterized protein LOC134205449 isoform X2 [Armigeres subalbatus]